jgi:hypothetical protein
MIARILAATLAMSLFSSPIEAGCCTPFAKVCKACRDCTRCSHCSTGKGSCQVLRDMDGKQTAARQAKLAKLRKTGPNK